MPTGAPSASSASPAQPARASPTASSVTADRCTMREHATRRKSRNAAPPPPQEKKKAMRHSLRRNIDRHARTQAGSAWLMERLARHARLQRVLLAFNRPPQGGTSSVVDICGGLPGFFPSKQRSAGHTQPTYQPGTGTGTLTLSALRVVPPDARASIHPSYIVNVARVHSFTHIFCSLYPPQDQQQSKKRRGNSVPPRRSLLAPFPCPGGDRYVVSSESPERV